MKLLKTLSAVVILLAVVAAGFAIYLDVFLNLGVEEKIVGPYLMVY